MVNDDAAETEVPLLEEELRVEKQSVATGKVQVAVPVVESVEEIARAELDEEQVEVTRVHVGREVTTAPEVRTEGDVVMLPVLEEVLVVEKRLVLKEELQTQGGTRSRRSRWTLNSSSAPQRRRSQMFTRWA